MAGYSLLGHKELDTTEQHIVHTPFVGVGVLLSPLLSAA